MYRGKRERPLPVMVRDRLGEWLSDEQFAGAYGKRGKPGWPPSRLALVTIFQMAEDLTDRQATCPQGHASSSWNPVTQRGTDTIVITFAKGTCGPCPVRAQRIVIDELRDLLE